MISYVQKLSENKDSRGLRESGNLDMGEERWQEMISSVRTSGPQKMPREAFAFDILEGSSQGLRQVSFLSKCRPLKEGTQNGHNIRRI